jgi:hypothetical protein
MSRLDRLEQLLAAATPGPWTWRSFDDDGWHFAQVLGETLIVASDGFYEIGSRVRAIYPNVPWGEGVVTETRDGQKIENPATGRKVGAKPLVVLRDDGTVGYFHRDQVEVVEAA